ncbi:uncharacterized protein LOC119646150 isoform X2 [Hermetia illucens]|nr:uncharacterized protein LOC119646150 isoform X2 [Hermetia illucens]XP_037902447.1 uncharacterized protein LOC119646150 isoform X2 [Hermetia illucens]
MFCARLVSVKEWNDYNYVNFTISPQTVNSTIKYDPTIDVKQDVMQCYIAIEGYMESKGRKLTVVNEVLDLCAIFAGKEMNIMTLLILMPFRQVRTMPQKCPVKKGFYFAKDVVMDTSQYPTVLPEAVFTVKVKLMLNQKDDMKTVYRATVVGQAKRISRRKSCSNIKV